MRQVTFGDGKVPTTILYTESDEQIEDIKRFCFKMDGTGEVLGVDKTYNLSNVFVTTTVYKNMSVVRNETGEAPLFLGSMLLHGNSDFELFTTFFSHIAAKLKDKQFSQLTIGSDEEGGIGKAIRFCFGEAKHTCIVFSSFEGQYNKAFSGQYWTTVCREKENHRCTIWG